MEYKGIYFDKLKSPNFYEAGAHFKYKDLYNKLVEIYNKRNNIYCSQNYSNLNLTPLKNNLDKKNFDFELNNINKEKNSSKNKRKTRNKKRNNNLNNSDSFENKKEKINLNLNILKKSMDNNYYKDFYFLKEVTSRISYYNKLLRKIHHNSINKNYNIDKSKNIKNFSVRSKDKENSKINKSIKTKLKKNYSIKNDNSMIYNYCHIKYKNDSPKKMAKLKTNNEKNKNIFNFGNYRYNLYDNIFLKNKIKNKLKQIKYNSLAKENSVNNKNNINLSKIKNKSKNNSLRSIDKIMNEKNYSKTKRIQCHINSVDYSSIYTGLNYNKTPSYRINNGINNKLVNEPIYNLKAILNKNKNYENLVNQVNKNQTSYVKIKQNQLFLTKSKKFYNKEIIIKERIKRDTQSTEYE